MALPAHGTFYVYILECADRSYYVGLAERSLDDRLAEHIDGTYESYTHKRRPVKLAWLEEFGRLTDAIARERPLKGWRRAKKEALIRGEYSVLPVLAKTAKTQT
jgi:predicted GIY-YIG superfamily endonuclease